ncbi:MAG: hypothetical protein JJ975_17520, partial [Bacteroidia bacterium]|nr:hypothetical protein [Bacteroidia bacterium]
TNSDHGESTNGLEEQVVYNDHEVTANQEDNNNERPASNTPDVEVGDDQNENPSEVAGTETEGETQEQQGTTESEVSDSENTVEVAEANTQEPQGEQREDGSTEPVEHIETTTADQGGDGDVNGGDDFNPVTPMRRWSVTASYGAGIGDRKFDGATNEQSKTVQVRNESEKQRFSNAAEITLNYRVNPQIEVFTGLNYFDRKERMVYEKVTEHVHQNITSQKVIEYHPVYGQREITLYDTTYQTVEVRNNLNSANSYKRVSVPLGFRYGLPFNGKWAISLNGNTGIEVLTKTSGTILDGDLNEIDLGSNFNRTSVGATFGLGATFSRTLSDRWTALFEPRATLYLAPANRPTYMLNQMDQGYGFYFGLKYGL